MPAIRLISSGLLLLWLPLNALAQGDTVQASGKKDVHSLYTGTGYGSNMIYLGSTISRDLPFGYGALSYIIGGELSLTGAAFYLPGLERSTPSFYSASMAYSHDFNSWFDISAGVYRYMVRPDLTDTLFSNFNYADLTLGIDWRILYTELSYGAFVMREPPAYLQVKNSRYFETPSFFRGKATFSFGPYANLLFGDLTTASIMDGTELVTTTQTLITPVTGSGTSGSGMGQGPGQGQGQGSSGSGTTTTTTTTTTTEVPTTTTVYSEKFDLIEMEFGLPVSFNLPFMSLEADVSYVFPMYSDPLYPGPKGFVVMFSAFLKIF